MSVMGLDRKAMESTGRAITDYCIFGGHNGNRLQIQGSARQFLTGEGYGYNLTEEEAANAAAKIISELAAANNRAYNNRYKVPRLERVPAEYLTYTRHQLNKSKPITPEQLAKTLECILYNSDDELKADTEKRVRKFIGDIFKAIVHSSEAYDKAGWGEL